MAIADSPIYYNTVDPRIRSVKDFQETDRIAMTAGKGTQHAVILQMAAASAFGWENREKLDALAVGISHPDGVVGLLSGGGSFRTHATTVPFIQMELADPKVRTLFSSYDVIGSRHTLIVAYAPERWRRESPRSIRRRSRRCRRRWRSSARTHARRPSCSCAASPPSSASSPYMPSFADDKMLYCTPVPTGVMARGPHDADRPAKEQAGELEGRVLRQRARHAGKLRA